MKSIKCPRCGLVYWMTDPTCKRCGAAAGETSTDNPALAQPQYRPQPPSTVNNFAEDAAKAKLLKNLKGDAIFFYIVGGLQTVLWVFVGELLIVDGMLNISLSFLVHKFRSRVAAIFLLCVTVLSAMFGLLAIAAGVRPGVITIIAVIVRLLTSVRMVYATFKLKGYVDPGPVKWLPPPPPSFHPEVEPEWAAGDPAPQWQPSK